MEINFELHHDFLIIVPGSVESRHGLHFIVDTGSGRTIIDERLAKRLHLQLGRAQLAGMDTDIPVAESTVGALKIGPLRFDFVSVLIRDLAFLRKPLGRHIDGIVGLDLLARQSFSLDYRTRKLLLGSCVAGTHHVSLVHDLALATVALQVAERSLNVVVDTAASELELFAHRLAVPAALKTRKAYGIAGDFPVDEVLLQSVRIGGDDLGVRHAFIVRRRSQETEDFDGLFSPVAAGITSMCVDLPHGRFTWTR